MHKAIVKAGFIMETTSFPAIPNQNDTGTVIAYTLLVYYNHQASIFSYDYVFRFLLLLIPFKNIFPIYHNVVFTKSSVSTGSN